MKLRMRIVSTLISMCLALGVMGFAVWAAASQTLVVNNTVSFTSIHVLATVTGTVTGAKAGTFTNYASTSTLAGDPEGVLGTWPIGETMEFDTEDTTITITITAKNRSTERSFTFELFDQSYTAFNGVNLDNTNIDRAVKYSVDNATPISNVTYTNQVVNVEPTKTATIVMTLKISNTGMSVSSFNNGFKTILRNVGEASGGEGFSFTPASAQLSLPGDETLTEANLPAMEVAGSPAFYGLYSDALFANKIPLPYDGTATTLYAKFEAAPENLVFSAINNGTEYSVATAFDEQFAVLATGDIEIPERYNWLPVTAIGENGFTDCADITSVVIPNSVTDIKSYAFSGCGISSVVIPSSVTNIDACAFYDCASLSSITIPDSVSIVGGQAFDATPWFDSQSDRLVYAGKVAYKYNGTMPDNTTITLNEDTKSITENAFYDCTGLTAITFLDGLTTIGYNAFSGCYSLATITIADSVAFVGEGAFNGTAWFDAQPDGVVYVGKAAYQYKGTMSPSTAITLDVGIKSITSNAFSCCTELTAITLPSSLTNIGINAFYGCVNFTSFDVSASSTTYATSDGVLYNKTFDTLICCPNGKTSVTILGTVTEISEYAFSNCTVLTNTAIPSTVTTIGDYAFAECEAFTTFTIGENVTNFGICVFADCTSLVTINFEEGNKLLENDFRFYEGIFNGANIESITLPSDLTKIGAAAFNYCSSLTSMVIPNSVTSIGAGAFYVCIALTNINIPSSVTSIGEGAFNSCTSLQGSITIPEGVTSIENNLFYDCQSLTEIVLPNSLISIGEQSFLGCKLLSSVAISSNVTSIGEYAFFGCSLLNAIEVDSSNTIFMDIDGVLYNKNGTTLITYPTGKSGTYTIASSTISIDSWAFYGCTFLTTVIIPNSVTNICQYAFQSCNEITTVYVQRPSSSGITIAEIDAFKWNFALAHIYVSDEASEAAYKEASGWSDHATMIASLGQLDFLQIGSTGTYKVTGIGNYASSHVVIPSTYNGGAVVEIGDYAFGNNEVIQSVVIPNGVTRIGEVAFYICTNLASVTFDGVSQLTTIGPSAFDSCANLTSFTIPESVTSIGYSAFSWCEGLTSITIPNSVTSLSYSVFTGCTALESVVIGSGLTMIDNYTFDGCTSLTTITIPSSVTAIGNNAFAGCTSLTTVYVNRPSSSSITTGGTDMFTNCTVLAHIYVLDASSEIAYEAASIWSNYAGIISLEE